MATVYAFKMTFEDAAGDEHVDAIWCKDEAQSTVGNGYYANYYAWSSAAKKVAGKSFIGQSLHQVIATRDAYLSAIEAAVEAGSNGNLATYKADQAVDTGGFFNTATLVSFNDTDTTDTINNV